MTLSEYDRLVITHTVNDIDRIVERGNVSPTERWQLLQARKILDEYAIDGKRVT